MSLSAEEIMHLSALMKKVEFPVPKEIFDVWCSNFTINTVELGVIRTNESGEKEIFLTYRKDAFFDGWHIPGSVILPGETVEDKIEKLIKSEFKEMNISKPSFFSWFERVIGRDEGLRGQEMGLFFIADFFEGFNELESEKFFSFESIPYNLIEEHKILIDQLKSYVMKV